MGVVLDSETESEREGKMKGSTYGKTVCASFFFFFFLSDKCLPARVETDLVAFERV